ncbi:thioredoxin [Pedobacter yulinensis]|uniref:Thioredoxin n=1 Tax=Pedobacter yulinensis TaxID=2126353 RepID=A0A2T3HI73_9SPHI|nr:thioredoxin family protein [Pedobacter yulinensis]PST82144.1 thioredoxin [Pedobacter yulinensis]
MKASLFLILSLFTMTASAQKLNKTMHDKTRDKDVLINQCDRAGLIAFPEFKEMYDAVYPSYAPDSATTPELKRALSAGQHITIVLGTWCGDSKLQVPHFLKVLDEAGFPQKSVSFIAVDGNKKAENGLIDKLAIERVPTFIVTDKAGAELGRIIEHPKQTLEKDLLAIVQKN